MKYFRTNAHVDDVLTKALPIPKYHFFKLKMGVSDFESRVVVKCDSSQLVAKF